MKTYQYRIDRYEKTYFICNSIGFSCNYLSVLVLTSISYFYKDLYVSLQI